VTMLHKCGPSGERHGFYRVAEHGNTRSSSQDAGECSRALRKAPRSARIRSVSGGAVNEQTEVGDRVESGIVSDFFDMVSCQKFRLGCSDLHAIVGIFVRIRAANSWYDAVTCEYFVPCGE